MNHDTTKKYYLLNYVFILGLIVLFLNDHIFKLAYSNWITGKLSDFMGVLILPMVLTYFFPKRILQNIIAAGAFFIFWKSPYSQSFIDFYNQITPIKITRLVDFTDLIALSMLPFSYYLIKNIKRHTNLHLKLNGLKPIFILIPTLFVFMATSHSRLLLSNGNLQCFRCSKVVKMDKTQLLNILNKNDYNISIDSFPAGKRGYIDSSKNSTLYVWGEFPYYKIDTLIIRKDTITDLQFALVGLSEHETKIQFNGMNISKKIPNIKIERKLSKHYKRLIKRHIRQTIKACQ